MAKHIAKTASKKTAVIAVAVIVAILVIGGIAFGMSTAKTEASAPENILEVQDAEYTSDGLLVNPIDWNEWMARNYNVYAWLKIDDTAVDQPILQHPEVDDYYLTHDIDGNYLIDGAFYTQHSYNSKDFTADPVTVIYGHTFQDNDKMFSTLHNFEDATFFLEHPTFYVYTPSQRLEYEIISAFEYDNSHIIETNDFANPDVRTEFFTMLQDPDSLNKNVRTLDAPLTPEDHVLILSTCTKPSSKTARYLVAAVLRTVEETTPLELSINREEDVIEELSPPIESVPAADSAE